MSESDKERIDTRGAEAATMSCIHLLVELTDFCNQRCIMCKQSMANTMHGHFPKQFMKFELFQKIVEDLKKSRLKIYSIDPLWAGESLMHPRFKEMMRYLFEENKKHDFFRGVVLNTNVSLMVPEITDMFLDHAEYLQGKHAGSFQLIFSLEAAYPETYAKIRGAPPKTLETVVRNIDYFFKERTRRGLLSPNAILGFIVMNENEREAKDFLKFWEKRLQKYSNLPFKIVATYPTKAGSDAIYFRLLIGPNLKESILLHRKVAERLRLVPRTKPKRIEPLKPKNGPSSGWKPCGAPWRTPNISARGIVTPCCRDVDLELNLGDIHQSSFDEIWYGEKATNLRLAQIRGDLRDFPMCLKCIEREGGVPSVEEVVSYLKSIGAEEEIPGYLSRWAENDKEIPAAPDQRRICLVSREYPPETGWGGIGSYTYDLAHGLAEKGHQVHVVAQGLEKDQEYWDGPVHVYRIFHRTLFRPKGRLLEFLCRLEYSWWLYKKLKEIAESYSIDIVEVPNFFAEGFVFSLFKKIPLVTRLHSPFWEVIKAYGWKDTFDRRMSCWLEDSTTLRSDLVTASTSICLQKMAKRLTLDPKKISVIPLGIPMPPEDDVVEAGTADGTQKLNVLFLGRLERRKGVHVLMRAIPIILEKIPQVNFTIVGRDTFVNERYSAFEGSREESFKETLLKDFPEKLKAHVSFEGQAEKDRLPGYFQKCDIFVAPSLYETFGLVYLEAMGYGKPVIGCSVGGVPEVIRDGETGLLVPPEDPFALAEAIVRLLKDPKRRAEMGKKARTQAVENFTKELMLERTLAAYQEVLKKKHK